MCVLGAWAMLRSIGSIEMRDIDEEGFIHHEDSNNQ